MRSRQFLDDRKEMNGYVSFVVELDRMNNAIDCDLTISDGHKSICYYGYMGEGGAGDVEYNSIVGMVTALKNNLENFLYQMADARMRQQMEGFNSAVEEDVHNQGEEVPGDRTDRGGEAGAVQEESDFGEGST